jgi:hypothetical protein
LNPYLIYNSPKVEMLLKTLLGFLKKLLKIVVENSFGIKKKASKNCC